MVNPGFVSTNPVSSHAVASYSTTVGVSSYSPSRAGSALKQLRQLGTSTHQSPTNNDIKSVVTLSSPINFKNFLPFKDNPKIKKALISGIAPKSRQSHSKEKSSAASSVVHKKTNSQSMKSG